MPKEVLPETLDIFKHLEVKWSEEDDLYVAQSRLIDTCVGVGDNYFEAVQNYILHLDGLVFAVNEDRHGIYTRKQT